MKANAVNSLKLIGKKAILKDNREGIIKSTLNSIGAGGIEIVGLSIEGIGEIDIKDIKEII